MIVEEKVLQANALLELGTCGMGMPVIRSNQKKIRTMAVGEILEVSSAHP